MSKHLGPHVWRPNRVLSVPQIDLSVCTERKMVNLYVYLRNFIKKSRFYRADTQLKNIKMVFLRLRRKNLRAQSYAYLLICVFFKEITALLQLKLHLSVWFFFSIYYSTIYLVASPNKKIYQIQTQNTRCAWAGGTFLQLCCCVSFWFWRGIGFLHTYVLRVQYSCGVVLVFWFWREIVFCVT
jgi:hypothetical protein